MIFFAKGRTSELVVGRTWVVGILPSGEILAAETLVLGLPGDKTLGARHGPAVRTHQLLVFRVGNEPALALVAPLEIGVFHEGPVPQLPLEEVVGLWVQDGFEHGVKAGEVS